MRRFSTLFALAIAFGFIAAKDAAAELVCKPTVTVTGKMAFRKNAAPKKARDEWIRVVTAEYGIYFNDPSNAEGFDDEYQCGSKLNYFRVCKARGRPCAKSAEGDNGATCVARDIQDSRCEDEILRVQIRLKDSDCYTGKIDGIIGKNTRNALRCFQRKNSLQANGQLNEETLNALKL